MNSKTRYLFNFNAPHSFLCVVFLFWRHRQMNAVTPEERQHYIAKSLAQLEQIKLAAKTPQRKLYAETMIALFHVTEGIMWDRDTRHDFQTLHRGQMVHEYIKAMADNAVMLVGTGFVPGSEHLLVETLTLVFQERFHTGLKHMADSRGSRETDDPY